MDANFHYFLSGWANAAIAKKPDMDLQDRRRLARTLFSALDFRDNLLAGELSNSELNKFATRIVKFVMTGMSLIQKYDCFECDEERVKAFEYDKKEKEFLLTLENSEISRLYYLGAPDVGFADEIADSHQRAVKQMEGAYGDRDVREIFQPELKSRRLHYDGTSGGMRALRKEIIIILSQHACKVEGEVVDAIVSKIRRLSTGETTCIRLNDSRGFHWVDVFVAATDTRRLIGANS